MAAQLAAIPPPAENESKQQRLFKDDVAEFLDTRERILDKMKKLREE